MVLAVVATVVGADVEIDVATVVVGTVVGVGRVMVVAGLVVDTAVVGAVVATVGCVGATGSVASVAVDSVDSDDARPTDPEPSGEMLVDGAVDTFGGVSDVALSLPRALSKSTAANATQTIESAINAVANLGNALDGVSAGAAIGAATVLVSGAFATGASKTESCDTTGTWSVVTAGTGAVTASDAGRESAIGGVPSGFIRACSWIELPV